MKVTLIQSTQNAVKLIADTASICYGREEAKNPNKLVEHLYDLEHHSTFEHVYFTWKIEGISRACLGQLTRHRHASFTVRSQRYCNESQKNAIIPESIVKDEGMHKKYQELLTSVNKFYNELIVSGYRREDARSILPMATETELYMSCNLRELIHIAELRIAQQAQKEIRELVERMVSEVVKINPGLAFMFK